MFKAIIDKELQLRMLQEADNGDVFRLVDSNRQHLREWLPWLDANTGPEHTHQFIQSILKQQAENLGFVCAIIF